MERFLIKFSKYKPEKIKRLTFSFLFEKKNKVDKMQKFKYPYISKNKKEKDYSESNDDPNSEDFNTPKLPVP